MTLLSRSRVNRGAALGTVLGGRHSTQPKEGWEKNGCDRDGSRRSVGWRWRGARHAVGLAVTLVISAFQLARARGRWEGEMRITKHGQDRGSERMGVDTSKFARLLAMRSLTLPEGNHQTDYGVLVVKDGALVSVLGPDMVSAGRRRGRPSGTRTGGRPQSGRRPSCG